MGLKGNLRDELISTHSLTKRLTKTRLHSLRHKVISTHSLTKRLTSVQFKNIEEIHISTHSLTKRLTMFLQADLQSGNNFNSQPHEEADDMACILPDGPMIFQLTASRRG